MIHRLGMFFARSADSPCGLTEPPPAGVSLTIIKPAVAPWSLDPSRDLLQEPLLPRLRPEPLAPLSRSHSLPWWSHSTKISSPVFSAEFQVCESSHLFNIPAWCLIHMTKLPLSSPRHPTCHFLTPADGNCPST